MEREQPLEPRRMSLKIMIPVLIGLGVIIWLFHDEFSAAQLHTIRFTRAAIVGIVLAWLAMAGRDFGLTWRFRLLTDGHLSWLKALKVNMLCEFTSAITPSTAGGSALGLIYLHREGIGWGRSATLMMTALFLDNLYFVLAVPVVLVALPYDSLFGFGSDVEAFAMGLSSAFWIVYGALALWTTLLFVGFIVKPHAVRRLLIALFRLPVLRRWQPGITEFGNNIVQTSDELRGRSMRWWTTAFAATALSWCSRFLVINMLFMGFVPTAPQSVVFGRQFIVWIVLMVSPTPGASGISEWLFKNYYGDLVTSGALVMVLAVFWRLISYYVYLVIGALIMPRWIGGIKRRRKSTEAK